VTGPATVGVDLGGTKLLAVAVDHDRGAVVASTLHPTPRGPGPVIDAVVEVVGELSGTVGLPVTTRVGVGVAGLVDHAGVLRSGPNQPGIVELDVAGELRARLGDRVAVDNDGNCAARAELESGAAKGHDDAVVLTLGTGIGAGLVVGGAVVRGAHGLAGEPGHTVVDPGGPLCPCGRRGCWERYASGAGLARMAREAADAGLLDAVVARGGEAGLRGEDVVVAAREGDADALAVMARFAWWTALGVANLAAVLDPEVVVIGGGLVEAADLWLDEVRRVLPELLLAAEHRPPPPVLPAHHGVEAAALGAALLARDTT
jgi:glucokinase